MLSITGGRLARHTRVRRAALSCACLGVLAAAPAPAQAVDAAVFGNNTIDDVLTAAGHTATVVTDAQLATPGFLDGYDLFVYTRNGISFGQALSPAAAAQVLDFADRRVVALNGDYADGTPSDAEAAELIANAAAWAGEHGGGYLGEYNGAVAALQGNANGLPAFGLLTGTAGPLFGSAATYGVVSATATGTGHPVLDGVALPRNFDATEFGAQLSGTDASQVLAVYQNDNPAVLAADPNTPPDCSAVALDRSTIKGSNGKFVTVTASGATDPDGDALTTVIDGVTQDEPVEGAGDGNRSPDARLTDPPSDAAQVRAERSGGGDGRVYRLHVTVDDGVGGTCTSTEHVAVPHDARGDAAVDSGAVHDSL